MKEITYNEKMGKRYQKSKINFHLVKFRQASIIEYQVCHPLNLTKNNFQVSERIMDQIISIKKEMSKSRSL